MQYKMMHIVIIKDAREDATTEMWAGLTILREILKLDKAMTKS